MKKLILLFLILFIQVVNGQINLIGKTHYKLDVSGYMSRCHRGCGGVDGLRHVIGFYPDNTVDIIWQGRIVHQGFSFNTTYTKLKPIKIVEFLKVNRWRNGVGNCNQGPVNRYNHFNITPCYTSFVADAHDGLQSVRVTSQPFAEITHGNTLLYLGESQQLKIDLQDHLEPQHYNWQYQVGTGPIQTFTSAYNNKHVLDIIGKDFLTPAAYGKTVSVWVNNNCTPTPSQNNDTQIPTILQDGESVTRSQNSNVVNFVYLKDAPKIIRVTPSPTTCYDSADGKVNIAFEKPLIPGEQLSVDLQNTDTNTSYSVSNISMLPDHSYTIENLPVGNYSLKLLGFYNGFNTYSPTVHTPVTFEITRPVPVDFTSSKVDVWCNGGNDGEINLVASGGVGNYSYTIDNGTTWIPFANNTNHKIAGLVPNTYKIKVRDGNGCVAKIQTVVGGQIQLGAEKEAVETIVQPAEPVSLSYTLVQPPLMYGGTNGKIVAAVKGGTIYDNNTYWYEWRNSAGTLLTTTSTQFTGGVFYITLNNIGADTYSLTVRDKNYNAATHNTGCTVVQSEQILTQPDPLKLNLELLQSISCNATNEFGNETDMNPSDGLRDEAQDGRLKAVATGGVPFTGSENGGLPYKFTWKKQNTSGTWDIWNNNDETAEFLSHGNYSVNIEDKNGIKLGVYTNNALTQEKDSVYFMAQPTKLLLTFTKENILCNEGTNGWAKANVVGGTPPYSYQWTNGATSQTITNLGAGNYFVMVTDNKGCTVQGSVLLEQPNGLTTTEVLKNPDCHNGNNGNIDVTVVGGVAPYTFLWNTGATTEDINGLTAGDYNIRVTDAQNCVFYKEFTLTNPEPIVVNLGPDKTLCNGQSLDLNITINDPGAVYSWTSTNGFTSASPTVSVSQAGTYTATVTSSLGCVGTDEITIGTNTVEIDSEFLLSSQAYINEEVVLVNTSNPFGENTEWIIPDNVTIIEQTDNHIILKFTQLGMHTVSLKQTQGDCNAFYHKNINVEERTNFPNVGGTSSQPFITEFTVTPNPNNGVFEATIKLQEVSPVYLRLFPYSGQSSLINKNASGEKEYTINFNVSQPAGAYVLVLETAKQTMVKKIIIF